MQIYTVYVFARSDLKAFNHYERTDFYIINLRDSNILPYFHSAKDTPITNQNLSGEESRARNL